MNRTALAFLALLGTSPLAAQSDRYGPLAVSLPGSVRMIGMGDIGVAGRDDDVIFYNPAQLFVARGTSFSVARLSPAAKGAVMSTVLRLGPGAIGIGGNYLEYEAPLSYPLTRNQILDRNFLAGTSVLGVVGYAQVYKGYRLGAAAKYAADARADERFGNAYFDAGVARDLGRFTTALSVQHFGNSFERQSIPTPYSIKSPLTTTLGAATARPLGPLDVVATAGVSYSVRDDITYGGGAEVGWSWITGYSIAGRAGAHSAREDGDTELMAGFGFTADRMTLDVAVERLPGNRAGYRAGIRIR